MNFNTIKDLLNDAKLGMTIRKDYIIIFNEATSHKTNAVCIN